MGCWPGPVTIEPLQGGLSNRNFVVTSAGERFFVRIGAAQSPHPIDRAAEIAATRAAGELGIGPEFIFAREGALVRRFVEGRTLDSADFANPQVRAKAVALLRRVRDEMALRYDGPAVDRSPAVVLRFYEASLAATQRPYRDAALWHDETIAAVVAELAPLRPALGHNDIHGANVILDDGGRVWLVDWEYAGFAPPLLDLASLCVNGLMDDAACREALSCWTAGDGERPSQRIVAAAKLAAALRDLFWGYAQAASAGSRNAAGFDAEGYIAVNEARVAELAQRFIAAEG